MPPMEAPLPLLQGPQLLSLPLVPTILCPSLLFHTRRRHASRRLRRPLSHTLLCMARVRPLNIKNSVPHQHVVWLLPFLPLLPLPWCPLPPKKKVRMARISVSLAPLTTPPASSYKRSRRPETFTALRPSRQRPRRRRTRAAACRPPQSPPPRPSRYGRLGTTEGQRRDRTTRTASSANRCCWPQRRAGLLLCAATRKGQRVMCLWALLLTVLRSRRSLLRRAQNHQSIATAPLPLPPSPLTRGDVEPLPPLRLHRATAPQPPPQGRRTPPLPPTPLCPELRPLPQRWAPAHRWLRRILQLF